MGTDGITSYRVRMPLNGYQSATFAPLANQIAWAPAPLTWSVRPSPRLAPTGIAEYYNKFGNTGVDPTSFGTFVVVNLQVGPWCLRPGTPRPWSLTQVNHEV